MVAPLKVNMQDPTHYDPENGNRQVTQDSRSRIKAKEKLAPGCEDCWC